MGELDMDLSLSPVRKVTARLGRRAQKSAFEEESGSTSFPSSIKPKDLFAVEDSSGEPQGRRRGITGVWEQTDKPRPRTAKTVKGLVFEEDDDDVIPIIPDLEDVQEEDMVARIAEAPSVSVNRVATYKELDNDLLKHAAFATLDDIDLRALTKTMSPESALKEPDNEWSWDTLFADIGGLLQEEWSSDPEEKKDRPYTAFNKFPV